MSPNIYWGLCKHDTAFYNQFPSKQLKNGQNKKPLTKLDSVNTT